MSEQGKAQIQTVAAGVVGFLAVVAIGLFIMRGGGAPKAPPSAYAPVDAGSSLPAPIAARPNSRSGGLIGDPAIPAASSPAPLLSDDVRARTASAAESAAASNAAAPAASAASGGASAPKLAVTEHLGASAASSSAQTVAVVQAASAPEAAAKPAAKKALVAPKLDLSKNTAVASTVHYGVTNRGELMGRAAGPVYNFQGGAAGGQQQIGELAGQTASQMDATTQQIDSSNLSPEDKAKLLKGLGQVRQTVSAGAGSGN